MICGHGVQRVMLGGQRTWTVVGEDHLPVGPAEEYLEFLRVAQQSSPNTVRSYATLLARWSEYLTAAGMAWDEVSLPFFVSFVAWLRTAVPAEVRRLPAGDQPAGPAKSTQASSAKAVCGRCEVDKNCLSYALETMPHGIWG